MKSAHVTSVDLRRDVFPQSKLPLTRWACLREQSNATVKKGKPFSKAEGDPQGGNCPRKNHNSTERKPKPFRVYSAQKRCQGSSTTSQDVVLKKSCGALHSFLRSVKTSSPSTTHAFACVDKSNQDRHCLVHPRQSFADAPIVTRALLLSAATNCLRAFVPGSCCPLPTVFDNSHLVFFHRIGDQLPGTTQTVALSIWCRVRTEDNAIPRRVPGLQSRQFHTHHTTIHS